LTDIWLEEATEMEESDVIQLYKRLHETSKYLKRVTMSFNKYSYFIRHKSPSIKIIVSILPEGKVCQ